MYEACGMPRSYFSRVEGMTSQVVWCRVVGITIACRHLRLNVRHVSFRDAGVIENSRVTGWRGRRLNPSLRVKEKGVRVVCGGGLDFVMRRGGGLWCCWIGWPVEG